MAMRYEGMLGPSGEALDYTRLDTFGMPFIGVPDFLPDRELQAKTVTFQRFGFGVFNTKQPSRKVCGRTYGEVMEGVRNSGWSVLYRSTPDVKSDAEAWIYLEWYEPYAINKDQAIPRRVEDDQKIQVKNADSTKQRRRVVRRRKPPQTDAGPAADGHGR